MESLRFSCVASAAHFFIFQEALMFNNTNDLFTNCGQKLKKTTKTYFIIALIFSAIFPLSILIYAGMHVTAATFFLILIPSLALYIPIFFLVLYSYRMMYGFSIIVSYCEKMPAWFNYYFRTIAHLNQNSSQPAPQAAPQAAPQPAPQAAHQAAPQPAPQAAAQTTQNTL